MTDILWQAPRLRGLGQPGRKRRMGDGDQIAHRLGGIYLKVLVEGLTCFQHA